MPDEYFEKSAFFNGGNGSPPGPSNSGSGSLLGRVYSENKKRDIMRILQSGYAHHNERLWMTGFLKFAGYSAEEVLDLIQRANKWNNFNPARCREQVMSVFSKPAGPANRRSEEGGDRYQAKRSEPDTYPQPSSPSSPSRFNWDYYNKATTYNNIGKYNLELMEGTDNIVSEYRSESGECCFSYGKTPEIRPWEVPLYRTIEGDRHCLAVVDIDADGDLEKAWRVTRRLMRAHEFRWVKFSGNKGFHGIDKLRGEHSREKARKHVHDICSKVDMEGLQADPRMFNPHQLVRLFAINWKSMHHSVPVHRDERLEDILVRSQRWYAG